MARRVLLIHGYSDEGKSFLPWAAKLGSLGIPADSINICNYITLNNEISLSDIAEGLARAIESLGWPTDQDFDAVVHSTGMLVIRAWLANNPERRKYLKHLIGLAPATWGSPLAHLGRSFLGTLFRGNKELGPDFLNAGDRVLDALELGSKFTWDLAHRDLLGDSPLFTNAADSPYVAVFIGNQGYSGIRELVNKSGSDGTVRWSGCALNSRKLSIDLRKPGSAVTQVEMISAPPDRLSIPMFAVSGKDHGTLLLQPADDLAGRIVEFLKIESSEEFAKWLSDTKDWHGPAMQVMKAGCDGWQQFVIHVVDEHRDPVPDFVVDVFGSDPGDEGDGTKNEDVTAFDADVHPYKADQSYRCFHVKLPTGITSQRQPLWVRIAASSGTKLISYRGYHEGAMTIDPDCPVILDISHVTTGESLFCPFTTTLVEIILNRQPEASVMSVNSFPPPANTAEQG